MHKKGTSDFDYFADLGLQFLFEPSRVRGKGGNNILVLFRNLALFTEHISLNTKD